MTDWLLQSGINNAVIALGLALAARAVQASGKRPALAHLLWLLVLVKLVTPPIVSVPIVPVPGLEPSAPVAATSPATLDNLGDLDTAELGGAVPIASAASSIVTPERNAYDTRDALLLTWFVGSLALLVVSGTRVLRFHRTLQRASRPAPSIVQSLAAAVAADLGLRRAPRVFTTSARIAPLVWSLGARARIVIPDAVVQRAARNQALPDDTEALRCILAHEIAHVRRRDPLVRWIEWAACVLFWWNPVVWWARRNLRANEELCCDAMALESLASKPEAYARSILAMVELVASRTMRPPAVASGIDGGGILERRFEMILSKRRLSLLSRRATAAVLLCSALILPLGLAYAAPFADPAEPTKPAPEDERHPHRGDRDVDPMSRANDYIRNHERMNHLSDDHLHRVFQAMPRIMHEVLKEGDTFELDPAMRDYLSSDVGLTHEQIELVVGVSRRVAPAVRDNKRTKEVMGALRKSEEHLRQAEATRDLSDKQIDGLMHVVRRLVHAILTEDGSFEIDDSTRDSIALRLQVSDNQLSLAVEIANKIAHQAKSEPENQLHAHLKKLGLNEKMVHDMLAHLFETGIERDRAEEVLGVIVRIVHGKLEHAEKSDDEGRTASDLDSRLRTHLDRGLGFSDEQIAAVIELTDRLTAHAIELKKGHKDVSREKHNAELHEVMKKIHAAVEAGHLTPAEAKAKMEAIHKKLEDAHETEGKRTAHLDEIHAKIKAAVEAGHLTREEAEAKLRELREKHGKQRDI